jgi:hypothetical protein
MNSEQEKQDSDSVEERHMRQDREQKRLNTMNSEHEKKDSVKERQARQDS